MPAKINCTRINNSTKFKRNKMSGLMVYQNVSDCSGPDMPSFREYLTATNQYGIVVLSISATLLIGTVCLFLDVTCYVTKHTTSRVKARTTFVVAVYPVTSLVCFCAILVPRANLLAEAITQGAFMTGMYKLFCLFMAYTGGCDQLTELAQSKRLILNVGPCCCYPCCRSLPTFDINRKTVTCLRLLVFQLPVVQSLIYLVYLIMWAEQENLYQLNYMYLQPIVIVSILFGIWGMTMTIFVLKDTLSEQFKFSGKFIVLQLVLVFSKFQGFITRILVWKDVLPCDPPITPQVYANLIHNTLMMFEMTLLAVFARNLYKRPLPDAIVVKDSGVVESAEVNNSPCDIIEKIDRNNGAYINDAFE